MIPAEVERRVNETFARAHHGELGREFELAYAKLLTLDPRSEANRQVVRKIVFSADPGRALFDWWEHNGAVEYSHKELDAPKRRPSGFLARLIAAGKAVTMLSDFWTHE